MVCGFRVSFTAEGDSEVPFERFCGRNGVATLVVRFHPNRYDLPCNAVDKEVFSGRAGYLALTLVPVGPFVLGSIVYERGEGDESITRYLALPEAQEAVLEDFSLTVKFCPQYGYLVPDKALPTPASVMPENALVLVRDTGKPDTTGLDSILAWLDVDEVVEAVTGYLSEVEDVEIDAVKAFRAGNSTVLSAGVEPGRLFIRYRVKSLDVLLYVPPKQLYSRLFKAAEEG